jgi:A nuclease of the HNH/ENDO VII superfamily with conserved WHH
VLLAKCAKVADFPALRPKLHALLVNHPQVFAKLMDNQISAAIKAMDDVVLQGKFVDDIIETRLVPNKLGANIDKLTPGHVKAWHKFSGFTTLSKAWTKTHMPLLDKAALLDDVKLEKLKTYYNGHQMPTSCTTRPKCTFQGDGFTVAYDDFGHPRFEPYVPHMEGIGKVNFNPGNSNPLGAVSSANDISRAVTWIRSQYPNTTRLTKPDGSALPAGRVAIKDQAGNWVECTWHHHEDGRNMIPVPSRVHDKTVGGAPHAGGNSLPPDLYDFFPSLKF